MSPMPKIKRKTVFIVLNLLVFLIFLSFFLSPGKKTSGVQIVTSKGTLLIGRDKVSKKIVAWFSPQIGNFDSGANSKFFQIEAAEDQEKTSDWGISWKWQNLNKKTAVTQKEVLLDFEPRQKEKEASVDVLSQLCQKNKKQSCYWEVDQQIELLGINQSYLCVSELKNSFQGGAHPISLKNLKTLDFQGRRLRFSQLIPIAQEQEELLRKLYYKIKLNDQNFSQDIWGSEESRENSKEEKWGLTESIESIEDRLYRLLDAKGYEFNVDNFCFLLKPRGLFLLFGFSHSKQVNRGLIFSTLIELGKREQLPEKLRRLFEEYQFSGGLKERALVSSDKIWQFKELSRNLFEVSYLKNSNLKINLGESTDKPDFLGFFWLKESPNLNSLRKNKFQEIEISSNREISLYKYYDLEDKSAPKIKETSFDLERPGAL